MATKRIYLEDVIRKSGMKKSFIADRLGISQASFTHMLNGERKLSFDEAKKIALIINETNVILDYLYNEHMISLYPGVLRNSNGEDWIIIEKKKKKFLIQYGKKFAIIYNWNPIWCSWENANYYASKEEALKDWNK